MGKVLDDGGLWLYHTVEEGKYYLTVLFWEWVALAKDDINQQLQAAKITIDALKKRLRKLETDTVLQRQTEASTQRLLQLTDDNPSPILVCHRDGWVDYHNKACHSILDIFHWDGFHHYIPEAWEEVVQEVLNHQVELEFEVCLADKVFLAAVTPSLQNSRVTFYLNDITSLKITESRLRKAHDYDHALLRISASLEAESDEWMILGIVLNEIQALMDYSKVCVYLLHEGCDEVREMEVSTFAGISPRFNTVALQQKSIHEMILFSHSPVVVIEDINKHDGLLGVQESVDKTLIGIPMRLSDGGMGAFVVISEQEVRQPNEDELSFLRDIAGRVTMAMSRLHIESELRAAEVSLREKQRRILSMQDFLDEIFCLTDMDGLILEVSPSILKVSGYHQDELIGKDVLNFCATPEQRKLYMALLMKHGEVRDFPVHMRAKAGHVIEFSMSARVILKHGKPAFVEAMMKDETERFRLQDDLLQARDAALASSKAKSDFLAVMSHELRTPIHGLMGMQKLIEEEPLTTSQKEHLAAAQYSAQVLHALVNDILDLSKIEAGAMVLNSENFKLSECIHEALVTQIYRVRKKGLALSFYLHNTPELIKGDKIRLRQILLNLVGNAVKFTEKGFVRVDVRMQSKGLEFKVSDSGIGMTQKEMASVFEAFTQMDSSTTRKYQGTGLGTTISKRLVEMMGGSIWVESVPNQGSSFNFCIKPEKFSDDCVDMEVDMLQFCALDAKLSKQAEENVVVGEGFAKRKRVLLAEDDPIGQKLMRKSLARVGFDVSVASDGIAALKMAEESLYDLILLDMQMPGMDGAMVAERFRRFEAEQQQEHTLIIGLTAHALDEVEQRCFEAGMDDFLTKPVDVGYVMQRLEQHLM